MSRPSLTAVMPNYNHARFLPRAIAEIAEQSRPPDEFLILDDASTDNSVEVMDQYARRYPFIRVFRNLENQGVNAAHNRLFAEARGDYLYAGAADDRRLPGFFQRAMEMAERYPGAGLIFGKQQVCNEDGEWLMTAEVSKWKESRYVSPEDYRRDYLEAELASHAVSVSTIYRRDCFLEVGGYREELGSWADAFAARAIGLAYGACYVPEDFAVHVKLAGSYSDQSMQAPNRTMQMIARAAELMRSEAFRDRFPETWVARWEREFRNLTIWQYWLGPEYSASHQRSGFLLRNARRLPRTFPALAMYLRHTLLRG